MAGTFEEATFRLVLYIRSQKQGRVGLKAECILGRDEYVVPSLVWHTYQLAETVPPEELGWSRY